MTNLQSSGPSLVPDPVRLDALAAAAARVEADIDAVPDDELEPHNRDVDNVVSTVLGANRLIAPYLPELAALPGLDMAAVRKLGDYADALFYWNASVNYGGTPRPELIAMFERAVVIRERTIHDVGALVRHGLLPEGSLEGFGGVQAYRKVARDLAGLAKLVRAHWPTIEGKTLITLEAMEEASTLAQAIMQAVGDREVATGGKTRDHVRRNKAYTLVMRTYHDVRQALLFLRRTQGDTDAIAPSLYDRRRSSRSSAAEDEADETPTVSAPTTGLLGAARSGLIVPDDATP